MSDILFGTCGWSYAEWEGILYAARQGRLKQYSSTFPTTDIDSTFYALPQEGLGMNAVDAPVSKTMSKAMSVAPVRRFLMAWILVIVATMYVGYFETNANPSLGESFLCALVIEIAILLLASSWIMIRQ